MGFVNFKIKALKSRGMMRTDRMTKTTFFTVIFRPALKRKWLFGMDPQVLTPARSVTALFETDGSGREALKG